MNTMSSMRPEEFVTIKEIGRGSYGVVSKAVHVPTQKVYALKKIPFSRIQTERTFRLIAQECETILGISHPNLTCGAAVLVETSAESDALVLVMDYANHSDLLSYMLKKGKLSESKAFFFFQQIVEGLDYLHQQGFVHRDLKLENIFLSRKRAIKIGDFGFSTKWSRETQLEDYPGSLHYSSPEIVSGTPYVGPEVDYWSLGVVLYGLVCGALPFSVPETEAGKEEFLNKLLDSNYIFPTLLSKELRTLIRGLLHPNPNKRFRQH